MDFKRTREARRERLLGRAPQSLPTVDAAKVQRAAAQAELAVERAAAALRTKMWELMEKHGEIAQFQELLDGDGGADDAGMIAGYSALGPKFAAHATSLLHAEMGAENVATIKAAWSAERGQAALGEALRDTARAIDGGEALSDPVRLRQIAEASLGEDAEDTRRNFLRAYRNEVGASAVLDAYERGELTAEETFAPDPAGGANDGLPMVALSRPLADMSEDELRAVMNGDPPRPRPLESVSDDDLLRAVRASNGDDPDADDPQPVDLAGISDEALDRLVNGE